ncbi:MAG TPA: hypothetical protein VFK07_02280 [Candidatus Paceibacterota bacterium]|nr:hypothetical protein [Candidatus Paceibacterota bacterium]
MRKSVLLIVIIVIGGVASCLYTTAQNQAGYYGLPVVACVDYTLPMTQKYHLTINITADGKNVPLDTNIGHDPGNCLRVIHTDDASGIVKITANDSDQYTLGDFFNVWHKQFSAQEFMGYIIGTGHHLSVAVNGRMVSTLEDTPLHPNETISIVYR